MWLGEACAQVQMALLEKGFAPGGGRGGFLGRNRIGRPSAGAQAPWALEVAPLWW